MNFKTVAKIVFFIQATLRCIGGLQLKFHVAPLLSCSGTRMSESLCRCTFYLRLKILATKLHHLRQITKFVFGRLLTIFSKTYPSFLTVKEGSTFLTKPLFPQGREDVTALRCSEPLRSKVGGPSKVSPGCAGWDRLNAMFSIPNLKPYLHESAKSRD